MVTTAAGGRVSCGVLGCHPPQSAARNDYQATTTDLRPIYEAGTEGAAALALGAFEATWGKKYPMVVRLWRENCTELVTLLRYPADLQKIMYTTNLIEGFHRQLWKVAKSKTRVPNDEAVVNMLYLDTLEAIRKWTARIQNWREILGQLELYSQGQVRKPLQSLES